MRFRPWQCAVAAGLAAALLSASAIAATPQETLGRLSPALVVVRVFDRDGTPIGQGSGVAIADEQVITNCHVAVHGASLEVRQTYKTYSAMLQYSDTARDLCQLGVPGLEAPRAVLGTSSELAVGQRVYALGAPQGREFTLSEGIISSLRQHEGSHYIQTSAAIFPGSSGGGLFDESGRLIGITTFYLVEGSKLNFALPADWIAELPQRTQSALKPGENALAWLNRALALEEKKDWAALLAHAQQWIKSAPQDAGFFLGEAYGGLKQYDQAIAAYRDAVRLRPDDADAWFNLGVSYGFMLRYPEAIEAYGEAQRLNPKRIDASYNLGNAYSTLKQYDLAIQSYREALRHKPDHVDAWINLGVSYGRARQYDEAIKAYRKALQLQPKSADAWYNLGVAHYRQGQFDKVQEIYLTLRQLDPTLAQTYVQLLLGPTQ